MEINAKKEKNSGIHDIYVFANMNFKFNFE